VSIGYILPPQPFRDKAGILDSGLLLATAACLFICIQSQENCSPLPLSRVAPLSNGAK